MYPYRKGTKVRNIIRYWFRYFYLIQHYLTACLNINLTMKSNPITVDNWVHSWHLHTSLCLFITRVLTRHCLLEIVSLCWIAMTLIIVLVSLILSAKTHKLICYFHVTRSLHSRRSLGIENGFFFSFVYYNTLSRIFNLFLNLLRCRLTEISILNQCWCKNICFNFSLVDCYLSNNKMKARKSLDMGLTPSSSNEKTEEALKG